MESRLGLINPDLKVDPCVFFWALQSKFNKTQSPLEGEKVKIDARGSTNDINPYRNISFTLHNYLSRLWNPFL